MKAMTRVFGPFLGAGVACGVLPPADSRADVVVVPSACCSTIQQGLDVAASGDTVLVLEGTYSGAGNVNLTFGGRDIVLRGETRDGSVIDGQNAGRILYLNGGETLAARVERLTMRRGGTGSINGGAIRVEDSGLTLADCRITDCLARRGGAVYASSSDLRIEECVIDGNHARSGGAIECGQSNVALFGSRILGNYTDTAEGYGGGLSCLGSTLTVDQTTFGGNWTEMGWGGGGVSLEGTTASFTSTTFAGNFATTHPLTGGGGLRVFGGDVLIDRCAFYENCSSLVGDDIYTEAASPIQITCTYVSDVDGAVDYLEPPLAGEVSSCAQISCADAPTTTGVYTVSNASVLLPENNPCGALIGYTEIGCGAADVTESDSHAGSALFIWPNPAQDAVTIRLGGSEAAEGLEIQFFDVLGRCVLRRMEMTTAHSGELVVPFEQDLVSGTYLVRIRSGDMSGVARLLVTQ